MNIGPTGPLENVRLSFPYGVLIVHPAMVRLIQWVLAGRGFGVDQVGRLIREGLEKMMGGKGLVSEDRKEG